MSRGRTPVLPGNAVASSMIAPALFGVVIVPGQQRHARRAAQRRGVKAVVLQPAARQLLQRRHVDRPAERAAVPEADVVDQHDHDVGRARRRLHLEARRRLRVARVERGDRLGLRLVDRQHGAVEVVGGEGRRRRARRSARRSGLWIVTVLHVGLSSWLRTTGFHAAESEMVRAGIGFALAARAHHIARAVLIGAEKRSAAMDAFLHAGFAGIERGGWASGLRATVPAAASSA